MMNALMSKLTEMYKYIMRIEDVLTEIGIDQNTLDKEIEDGKIPLVGGNMVKTVDVARYMLGDDLPIDTNELGSFSPNILEDITEDDVKEMIRVGVGEGTLFYNEKRNQWQVAFSMGYDMVGKRRRKVLTEDSRDEVMRMFMDYKEIFGEEILSEQTFSEIKKSRITVMELVECWLEVEWRKIREQSSDALAVESLGSYDNTYNNRITKFFEGKNILAEELNHKMIRELLDYVEKSRINGVELKRKTVVNHQYPLSKAYQYGVENDLVIKNPFDGFVYKSNRRDKKAKKASIPLDDLKKILGELEGNPMRIIYEITLAYGLRRGETMGLKWTDIDFEKDTITIQRSLTGSGETFQIKERTKGGEITTYGLNRDLKRKLLEHREKQEKDIKKHGVEEIYIGFVCGMKLPMRKKVKVPNTAYTSRVFKEAAEKCGVDTSFHEIRHTVATELYRETSDILLVQNFLRHKDSKTTEGYIHGEEKRLEEATEKAGDFYLSATKNIDSEKDTTKDMAEIRVVGK